MVLRGRPAATGACRDGRLARDDRLPWPLPPRVCWSRWRRLVESMGAALGGRRTGRRQFASGSPTGGMRGMRSCGDRERASGVAWRLAWESGCRSKGVPARNRCFLCGLDGGGSVATAVARGRRSGSHAARIRGRGEVEDRGRASGRAQMSCGWNRRLPRGSPSAG